MIDMDLIESNPLYQKLMPQDNWSQYEAEPDLSEVPDEILRVIPPETRKGKDNSGRIDTIMLTL